MKRLFLAILPWMVSSLAFGQLKTADLQYTFHPRVQTEVLRIADEAFVSAERLRELGWEVDTTREGTVVKLEDETFPTFVRSVGGKPYIPIRGILDSIGASTEWILGTDSLEIISPIKKIVAKDGNLQIVSTLSLKAQAFVMTDPVRHVYDIRGAKLNSRSVIETSDNVRVVQFSPNVVRIIVQSPELPLTISIPETVARNLEFSLGTSKKTQEDTGLQNNVGGIPGGITSFENLPLRIISEAKGLSVFRIDLPGVLVVPPEFRSPDSRTLEIEFSGLMIKNRPSDASVMAKFRDLAVEQTANGTKIRMQFLRAMGAEISSDINGITISVLQPNVGDGNLASKVIVIDPGHGGKDPGAHRSGVSEKFVTLRAGLALSKELTKRGAVVIMTRTTDVFVPLERRARIANESKADFFISIHINSNRKPNSQNGSITFHHKSNAASRIFAKAIHDGLARTTGIRSIGVWSDTRIYQSGFAVLRLTRMPGALLELGFVNNDRDRAIMTRPDFSVKVAAGILQGILEYLGDE